MNMVLLMQINIHEQESRVQRFLKKIYAIILKMIERSVKRSCN